MKIAVLGTGIVAQTIASALVRAGHAVHMGSRSSTNPKADEWAKSVGTRGFHGTYAEAAQFGQIVFNCTAGVGSLEALQRAGRENLRDKILIDVANPLDFSKGMPPTLTVCNTDSLGEQIQRTYPRTRVVKTLNTLNAGVMVEPDRIPGEHHIFVSGDDPNAKAAVAALLKQAFGWPSSSIIDLGDIKSARATEMLVLSWVRIWATLGTPDFNFHIAAAPVPFADRATGLARLETSGPAL